MFPRSSNTRSGFTLVEMAFVLVIVGLVMMTVFPALSAVRSANQRALTESNLHSLMLATAAYVQANGCLPCPANAALANTNNNTNFGTTGNAVACGACTGTAAEGIPPFVALGIPASTAHDGWGHWISMRVDPALTALPSNSANCSAANTCSVFAPPTAPCTATDVANGFCTSAQIGFSAKAFCKSGLSPTQRILVTTPGGTAQKAAVIFVSHGSTGYGSCFAQPSGHPNNGYRLPFPANYTACSTSGGYAQCNAAAGGNLCATNILQFYDSPTFSRATDSYDDLLAYADRNTLVSMFGNGSCQTVW